MAKSYGDVAEFFVVYIREAHAADSSWPAPVPGEDKILTPKTYAERTVIAGKCLTKLEIKMPCLIDDMDDSVEKAYRAWPDRLFIVDLDGKITVRADPGPWGFRSAVNQAAKWLKEKFPDVDAG